MDINLISDFTGRPIPFASIDKASDSIIVNTENAGFEGLHDISVVVSNGGLYTSSQAAVRNNQAKFRVEIAPGASSQGEAQSPNSNLCGTAERSSETLPIQDARSDDL